MTDILSEAGLDTTNIAMTAGAAAIGRGRLGGQAMAAMNLAGAASSLVKNGRLDQSTLMSTASSAATMVGMRLIPGVGWAAAAYTVADIGSRAFLGKPFGETMVGKPIDWAMDKAGRAGLSAATGALDLVGWKGGSDFLRNTVYPWAYPNSDTPEKDLDLSPEERASKRISEARESGLLPRDPATPILMKGPSLPMDAGDTISNGPPQAIAKLPINDGRVDLAALAEHGTKPALPSPHEVGERRETLLAREQRETDGRQTGHSLSSSLGATRTATDLTAAISAEAAIAPQHPANDKMQPATKDSGRSYDD